MDNIDEITIDEAIKEIDEMIVGYQYHMYGDDGKIDPAYSCLIKPCNALIMAIKVLEKEKERKSNGR